MILRVTLQNIKSKLMSSERDGCVQNTGILFPLQQFTKIVARHSGASNLSDANPAFSVLQ